MHNFSQYLMSRLQKRPHFLTHNFSFDTKRTVFAIQTDAKMICLLVGKELRQIESKMRRFYI